MDEEALEAAAILVAVEQKANTAGPRTLRKNVAPPRNSASTSSATILPRRHPGL